VNGRRVLLDRVSGSNARLDVSSLEPGIYVMRVLDGDQRLSGRFVKR
jgi:hypothetical protein